MEHNLAAYMDNYQDESLSSEKDVTVQASDDEIQALIGAAEWFCKKDEYDSWEENHFKNRTGGIYQGYLYLGNDLYTFSIEESNIQLTEYIPIDEMYTAPAEEIDAFFEERNSDALYENCLEEQHQVSFKKFGTTYEALQENLIRNMLSEGMIETDLIPAYQKLKENKTGYMYQFDNRIKQLENADKLREERPRELISKDRLTTHELKLLSSHYYKVSKCLDQKYRNPTDTGRMLVKEMMRDGLSESRISLICKDERFNDIFLISKKGYFDFSVSTVLRMQDVKEFHEYLQKEKSSSQSQGQSK